MDDRSFRLGDHGRYHAQNSHTVFDIAIPNKCYVYFGLRGDFVPEELTQRIGITPTESCLQGARIPKRGIPKTSIWNISTDKVVAEFVDVYELADQIIDQIGGKADEFRQVIEELGLHAVLEVVIHFSTDDNVSTPAIGFSSRVLNFLADVGATIDIDTYILPPDDVESA